MPRSIPRNNAFFLMTSFTLPGSCVRQIVLRALFSSERTPLAPAIYRRGARERQLTTSLGKRKRFATCFWMVGIRGCESGKSALGCRSWSLWACAPTAAG